MKAIAALATVALLATLLVGCGGGDGDSASASLTKTQFVRQATAICNSEKAGMLRRLGAYFEAHEGRGSEREIFADALRVVYLPAIEDEVAKIDALRAPSGDEEAIEAILAAEQRGVAEVAELKSAKTRFEVERYFSHGAQLAREYGIPACGNSSTPAE